MVTKISTSFEKYCYKQETFDWTQDESIETNLINIYPQKKYQTILGFGGAFTEAGGYALSKLSEEKKQEAIKAYFSEEGLTYSFCRTHINSCDFSLGNYTYVKENDTELKTFSIAKDFDYLIPFIKAAQEASKSGFQLMASPWSPPAFMKTNNEMNHGGKLKPEYKSLWAKYIVKYIQEYKKIGIPILAVSIQNEPKAVQTWDSCVYTTEEELDFGVNYLKPEFDKNGLDVKIIGWDHNKERVYEKASEYFGKGSNAFWAVGFHWYSGDHFEALRMVREDYPEKQLIFTEGCVEYARFAGQGEIFNAQMYAHDIIGNLNSGTTAYVDWNMFLDENGGPNHVGNFCAAPIMCLTDKNEFEKRLTYYYIGHFSKYIKPGAQRIGFSSYTDKLEVTAFMNPDGRTVLVVLNKNTEDIPFVIRLKDCVCYMVAEKNSIATIMY